MLCAWIQRILQVWYKIGDYYYGMHVILSLIPCRFRATIEQLPLVKSARSSRSIVKLKQHLSKVKTVSVEFHHLVQSEVYLCFRAYNHIAGKIMKV